MTTQTRAPGLQQPRGALRLMFDPVFGGLFWGKIFAIIAVWTHSILAAIVVFDATGSAVMVGLVGVVQFAPQLILSPISGKWADIGDPIRQIILGRFICIVGSGLIAVWLFVAPDLQGTAAAIPVLVGSSIVGFGFVIGGPAMQSVIPSLIRDGELATAMALNSFPMTIGRILGPAIGAYLATHLGAATGFAFAAALQLIFAVILLVINFPTRPKTNPRKDYRVRTALRHVWEDRPLLLALLAVATVGFASDPSITLTPSMAAELGGGTRLIGFLSASFGAGAALGMAVLAIMGGRLAAAWVSAIGLWLLMAGCAVLTMSTVVPIALGGFALAGVGFGWAMTGLATVVQERTPEELRGRIMALWMAGFVGARPVAAGLLGGSADLFNVRVAFVIAAVVMLGMVLAARPSALSTPIPASA